MKKSIIKISILLWGINTFSMDISNIQLLKNEEFKKKIERKQNEMNEILQQFIQIKNDENQELKKKIEELTKSNSEKEILFNNKIQELENQNKEQQQKIEEQNQDVNSLVHACANWYNKYQTADLNLDKKNDSVKQLFEQQKSHEKEVENFIKKEVRSESQNQQLQSDLDGKNNKITELESVIEKQPKEMQSNLINTIKFFNLGHKMEEYTYDPEHTKKYVGDPLDYQWVLTDEFPGKLIRVFRKKDFYTGQEYHSYGNKNIEKIDPTKITHRIKLWY